MDEQHWVIDDLSAPTTPEQLACVATWFDTRLELNTPIEFWTKSKDRDDGRS